MDFFFFFFEWTSIFLWTHSHRPLIRPESNVFMCHIHGENQKWFYYTAAAGEWTTPIMDNGWYTAFAHFYDASVTNTKKKKEKSLVEKNDLRSLLFVASQCTHSFTLALFTPPAAVQNLELDSFHYCPMNWISIRWSLILSRFFYLSIYLHFGSSQICFAFTCWYRSFDELISFWMGPLLLAFLASPF